MNQKRIVQSNFSIKFPRQILIRRSINDIEDIFQDKYLRPTLISIPDEVEPALPRISMQAINGHSTISFSQISVDFIVNYDENFNSNYDLCEEYLNSRLLLILNSLEKLSIDQVLYLGISTRFESHYNSDKEIINNLTNKLLKLNYEDQVYDLSHKVTFIEDDTYFTNLEIGNYRTYNLNTLGVPIMEFVSFEKLKLEKQGLFVNLDINSRYHYNITGKYTTIDDSLKKFEAIMKKTKVWFNSKIDLII